jgi:hypothetical protein
MAYLLSFFLASVFFFFARLICIRVLHLEENNISLRNFLLYVFLALWVAVIFCARLIARLYPNDDRGAIILLAHSLLPFCFFYLTKKK